MRQNIFDYGRVLDTKDHLDGRPFGNGFVFRRLLLSGFAAFTALSGSYQGAMLAIGQSGTPTNTALRFTKGNIMANLVGENCLVTSGQTMPRVT